MCGGCVRRATIEQPIYSPFLANEPITDEALNSIRTDSPKDAVFADLLQAFALMRKGNITNLGTQKEILSLLQQSVSSFEDMSDPVNFSMAFSADEDKAFRGRPHERMFASTMAGVFLLAHNQPGQALPYLRNAEFLDARFQKLPFGTDAPFIYALMYRSLLLQNAAASDVNRAHDGIFRSVRFLTLQQPLIEALVSMANVDLRSMAISNRLAYMIYEISIYHSLISSPNNFDIAALLNDAAANASIFISSMETHFADEYKERLKPLVNELAHVYGMDNKKGIAHLETLALDSVAYEAKIIGEKMTAVVSKHPAYQRRVIVADRKAKELTQQIVNAASAEKMIVSFSGHGPKIVREGSYKEISVVKPSPDGSVEPEIRERTLHLNTSCGFHRTKDEGFSVVLCKPGVSAAAAVTALPSLELLSASRKATSVQGREFDKVLKGRAQFRAATEKIAEVTAWSAFFLFILGSQMMSDCQSRGEGQACYIRGLALWAVAGITILFSGTVWLIGRTRNPAADSRYLHLLYESAWVSI